MNGSDSPHPLSGATGFAARVLFALAAAVAATLLVRYIALMATSSLWIDEIYSVRTFSSPGAWVAWTDYHAPNNHILFNILNSVWPADIAYHPEVARLSSFVAVAASLSLLGWYAIRERAWGAGALALLLLATNTATLDLTLQARGYGLAMLAGMVQLVASARYLDTGARGWLIAAAAGAFAGIATLPVYVLFAAPLALGLLILRPRRAVWATILLAGLLVAAFYAPTARQMLAAASDYADRWGAQFATVTAVYRTLGYVLLGGIAGVLYLALIAVAIATGFVRGGRDLRALILLCLGALAVFFVACLLMETPGIRTTQYAALVPLVLLVAATGADSGVTPRLRLIGNAVLLAAAIPLVAIGIGQLRDPRFVPIENWLEAARAVDTLAPPGTPVYATYRGGLLADYLDDPGRLVDAFDAEPFRRGALVVADGNFRKPGRFTGADHASGAVDITIPQRRGGRQVVSFVPQSRSPVAISVTGARPSGLERLTDGDTATVWRARKSRSGKRLRLTLTPDGACPRLLVLGGPGRLPATLAVSVEKDGASRPLGPEAIRRIGDLVAVTPGDTAPERIVIDAPRRTDGRRLVIREVWCTD